MLSETIALTVAGPTNPEAVGECCEVEREDERGEVLLLSWRRRWKGLGRGAAAVNNNDADADAATASLSNEGNNRHLHQQMQHLLQIKLILADE